MFRNLPCPHATKVRLSRRWPIWVSAWILTPVPAHALRPKKGSILNHCKSSQWLQTEGEELCRIYTFSTLSLHGRRTRLDASPARLLNQRNNAQAQPGACLVLGQLSYAAVHSPTETLGPGGRVALPGSRVQVAPCPHIELLRRKEGIPFGHGRCTLRFLDTLVTKTKDSMPANAALAVCVILTAEYLPQVTAWMQSRFAHSTKCQV